MSKLATRILLLAYFVIGYSAANPLDHRFQKAFKVQKLSIEHGLSQSVVNAVLQDQDGYIWIATEDGLNRFDGYDFKVFEHQHSDQNSLHDNLIYSILEDKGNGLWVGTSKGLSYLDFKTESFTNYSNHHIDLQVAIGGLIEAKNGDVFIGSDNGLFILEKQSKIIAPFVSRLKKSLDEEIISFDKTDTHIWLATEKCIYSIEQTSLELTNHCSPQLTGILEDRILKVVKIKEKKLWIASNNGLIHYDLVTDEIELLLHDPNDSNSISANWVQALAFDSNNNLWIGTVEGVSLYRFDELRFEHFQHQAHDSDGLSSNDVMRIFIDSSGLIWLGTYTGGINILDPFQTGFRHILTKSELSGFNASNTIHGIAKDNSENLWLASYGGGIIKFDLMTGEISRPFHSQLSEAEGNPEYAYSMLIDLHNRLWVGTHDGLVLIDLNTQSLISHEVFKNNESINFDEYVFQIYEDHKGRIYIATMEGFYEVAIEHKKNNSLNLKLTQKLNSLPYSYRDRSIQVTSLLQTADGNFWVGGLSGLVMYSQKQEKWTHYYYQSENPQSLSNDDVQVLYEDSRGILWVGTANGLNKVHRENDDEVYFERITKEQGLPNNSIYGVLEDNNHQIWLSTNLGLVRYSEHSGGLQSFRRDDGISSDEFNKGAYLADNEGILYFGSINGVTIVDSNQLRPMARKNNLQISEIKLDNRTLNSYWYNHSEMPEIFMSDNETTIKITVSDLYYRKLGTPNYRYRLLGLDEQWNELGRERSFNLTGLAEGRYLLDIQSRTSEEHWSSNSKRLVIQVDTDFSKSKSAIYLVTIISIMIFVVIVYLVKRYYASRLTKIENRIKIESIRLKEVKKENSVLKRELNQRIDQINVMHSEIDQSSQFIASQEFRDPITGFYRFQFLGKLLDVGNAGKELTQSFNLIMLFQISALSKIEEKYGAIGAAEVNAYVATELRKVTPANTHICWLNNDSVLIFGNSIDYESLTSALFNLRSKIERSQLAIANNLSVTTEIGVSYIEIYPDKISDISILITLAEVLTVLHESYNLVSNASLIRVDLNDPIESYSMLELEPHVLVSNNRVTLNVL